jgi:hypothetical protein
MMDGMNNGMNNVGAWIWVMVGLCNLSFSGLLFG